MLEVNIRYNKNIYVHYNELFGAIKEIDWKPEPTGSTATKEGPDGSFAEMAATENSVEMKRKADDSQEKERGADGDGDGEDADWVGPMPSEATKAKKRKGGVLKNIMAVMSNF